jgi:hypothetical protein
MHCCREKRIALVKATRKQQREYTQRMAVSHHAPKAAPTKRKRKPRTRVASGLRVPKKGDYDSSADEGDAVEQVRVHA